MDLVRQLLRRLTWSIAAFWLLLLGGVWLFVEFADEVYEGAGLPFDNAVLEWLDTVRTPWLTDAMYALSVIGDVPVTLALAALVLVVLAARFRNEVVAFAVALGGAAAVMVITKLTLARPRPDLFPDLQLYPTSSPSFPSGHATGSAAFYLALYLIARRIAPGRAWIVGTFGALMTLGIAFSRLYLQVHYPSDVLAGLALGVSWVLGAWALLHRERAHGYVVAKVPRDLADAVRLEAERQDRAQDEVVADLLAAALERGEAPLHGPGPGGAAAGRAERRSGLRAQSER